MGYETRSKKPQKSTPQFATDPGQSVSASVQDHAARVPEAHHTSPAVNGADTSLVATNDSSPGTRHERSAGSQASTARSTHSSETVKAKKLAAEARHAHRLADLAAQKLELDRKAAELDLQAELASIEVQSCRSRSVRSDSSHRNNVKEWLNDIPLDDGSPAASRPIDVRPNLPNQATLGAVPRPIDVHTPYDRYRYDNKPETYTNRPLIVPTPTNVLNDFQAPKQNVLVVNERLLTTLDSIAASKPGKSTIKLPFFDGSSPTEWLVFKRMFLDTQASYTPVENLARIGASLRGVALEAVYILLVSASDAMEVIDALEMRFGRPEKIVLQEVNSIRSLPKVSTEGSDLASFACRVKNCVGIMKLLEQYDYLHSPELFSSLIQKLTPIVRAKWYDYAGEQMDNRVTKLELLSIFLTREVELQTKFGIAHDYPTTSSWSHPPRVEKNIRVTEVGEKSSGSHNINNKPVNKCIFCKEFHNINKCDDFLTMSVNDRWQWVKKNKVCHRCLENRPHRFNLCKVKLPCSVGGCIYKHHSLLHNLNPEQNMLAHADFEVFSSDSESETIPQAPEIPEDKTTERDHCQVEISAHAASTPPSLTSASIGKPLRRPVLKVVAVKVSGPRGCVDTYALLDDGCTATFIDSEISKRIGAEGPSKRVRIDCVGGLSRDCYTQYVDFDIKGLHCSKTFQVHGARSIDKLSVNYRPAINQDDISNCPYLSDLSDVICCEGAQPMLIIGVDNWQLTIASNTRVGKKNQPVAIQTALGWVLYGFISSKTIKVDISRHSDILDARDGDSCFEPTADIVQHANILDTQDNDFSLDSAIKNYYKLDSIGITKKDHRGTSDTHALKILKDTVRRLPAEERFEAGLLWRPDVTTAPNNFKLALSRFLSLEKKFKTNDQFAELYKKNIHAMLDKNYAELCTEPPVGITWYLPHFGVTHAHKPGKLRVVHDAAAKYEGVSLNSLLLPGPDLLQPLLAILMRFREESIALTADIREMFPQVRIRKQDRDAQRFLWRDHPDEKIKVYRMSAMMFGTCSSPCTALYVKNLNATDLQDAYPAAAHATISNTYMDDCISSVTDVNKAAQLAHDIVELNKKAGFEMRDWISNDPAALSLVPTELRSQKLNDVNLGNCDQQFSRVLGLIWQPQLDMIGFGHGFQNDLTKRLSKRDALSHLMRIYDPLGILGPIVSRGRVMFQSVWRQNLGWDDKLSLADQKSWDLWLQDVKASSQLQLPRWYSSGNCEIVRRELHLFSDASELAYSAVAYWRFTYSDGTVKLALIGSKSRVSPLKPTSIPRLELQAALIAVRFASLICESHVHKPSSRTFWCDSLNVLGWLRSDARTFKPFVAHRIGEILETSDVKEWRWIPTAENVADDATRTKRIVITEESRWVRGPSFLLTPESEWPSSSSLGVEIGGTRDQLEKKNSCSYNHCHDISLSCNPSSYEHCHFISSYSSPLVVSPERVNTWTKLIRATAIAHKFLLLLKDTSRPKNITAEDLQLAEIHVLRKSQMDSFPNEYPAYPEMNHCHRKVVCTICLLF